MQAVSELLSSDKTERTGYIKQNSVGIGKKNLVEFQGKDTFYARQEKVTLEFNLMDDKQRELVAKAVAQDCQGYMEKLDDPIQLEHSIYRTYIRRIVDIIISGAALVLTLPVNFLLAIITYFDVGSPIFYKQERVGKNGKVFVMVKFRNMTDEMGKNGVLLMPEQRVTKWGKFVRKTSLDELLNFWCIFTGKMTLIGPRPLPVKYSHRYSREHNQRHMVKPGLECPFHTDKLNENEWKERFENDLWYVRNMNWKTDIIMMGKLIKKIFSKEERSKSAYGQTSEFIGYDSEGNIIDSNNLPAKYLYQIEKEKSDKNKETLNASNL